MQCLKEVPTLVTWLSTFLFGEFFHATIFSVAIEMGPKLQVPTIYKAIIFRGICTQNLLWTMGFLNFGFWNSHGFLLDPPWSCPLRSSFWTCPWTFRSWTLAFWACAEVPCSPCWSCWRRRRTRTRCRVGFFSLEESKIMGVTNKKLWFNGL